MKIKKLYSPLLSLLLIPCLLCSFATIVHAESGTFEYAVLDDGTAQITGYTAHIDSATAVVIPKVIDEYPVSSVAPNAFEGYPYIMSVSIPTSVVSIGENAFADSLRLFDVYYGGTDAQWNALLKDNIAVPNDYLLAAELTFTDKDAFCRYTVNTDGTATITNYFGSQEGTVLAIPTTVGGHKVYAVGNDPLDAKALVGWESLETLVFPETLTYLYNVSFYNTSLKELVFPSHITSYSAGEDYLLGCFEKCEELEQVELSDAMESIPARSFAKCTSLKTVSFSANCTYIGKDAFSSCTALTDVYYGGSKADWQQINVQSGNTPLFNATIHYAGGTGVLGDIDGNDTVNMRDALALYQSLSGRSALSDAAAAISDVNNDGTINMRDVLMLYQTATVTT